MNCDNILNNNGDEPDFVGCVTSLFMFSEILATMGFYSEAG